MRHEPAANSSPPTTSPMPSPTYQGLPSNPVLNATLSQPSLSGRRRDWRLGLGVAGSAGFSGLSALVLVLGVGRERVVEIDHEFIDADPLWAAALLLGALEDRLLRLRHLVDVFHEVGDGVG